MRFNKSYRLLRFLNREHSSLLCHFLGGLAWIGAWVFTQSISLADLMRNEFLRDDFRLAFRRAAWFARHVFPILDFFEDPFFDFTTDTNANQRRALERFVSRYRNKSSPTAYLSDMLFIRAADIHGQLEQESGGLYPHDAVKGFYDNADEVLALLASPPQVEGQRIKERKDDFSKADATSALRELAATLPLDRWPWYVISGTFLGLHREGGFLAHDYDIDVGIHGEQISVSDLFIALAASPGFVTKKIDHHIEITKDEGGLLHFAKRPALVKLVHKSGHNLDVFIHYTENGRCWHGSIIHRWENTPFKLEPSELEGVSVYKPADADRYLTENYGDWRTPVKHFACTTDTPNLVVAKNFLSVALFLKRLSIFCESDAIQADKLRKTLINSGVIEDQQGVLKVVRSFEVRDFHQGAT